MCLITPNKEVKTATEDMVVYKVLTSEIKSIYHTFDYVLGVLYETEIKESNYWTGFGHLDTDWLKANYNDKGQTWYNHESLMNIGQGFHSLLNLEDGKVCVTKIKHGFYGETDIKLYECTIPKGSKYYDSPYGLLVSNKIIINKEV